MGNVTHDTLLDLWTRYRAAPDMLERLALRNELLTQLYPRATRYLLTEPDHAKLIAALDKWNPARASLPTYLRMVAVTPQRPLKTLHATNECDHFTAERGDGDLPSLASTVAGADADPAHTATVAAAWSAIAETTSPVEAQALDLLYRQGMSVIGAADELGVSTATVLRRQHSALAKLRCNPRVIQLLGEVACGSSIMKMPRAATCTRSSAACRRAKASASLA